MKKIKWIIGLLLLIAVIFTAYILYNNLSKDYVLDRIENDINKESYNSYKAPDFTVLNEDLKNKMLEYMTEDMFEKLNDNAYKNVNGKLYIFAVCLFFKKNMLYYKRDLRSI